MVQRIDKKVLYLEIIASLVVLLTLILLVNKYIIHNRAKSNIVRNVEHSVSRYQNAKNRQTAIVENFAYGKERSFEKKLKNKITINLITQNNDWSLENNNTDYYLFKKNGQLGVSNYDKNKKFKIEIEEVGASDSFRGKAILNLPAQVSKKFKIYEQEDYLPIFGYHYVSPDHKKIEERRHFLELHLSDFRKQIAYETNELSCHWLTFGEVMEKYVLLDKKTPRRTCVATFDDGHKDSYQYIFPVLKEFDIPATFYIITDFIGNPGYMTWEQLDELYRSGNELGAHTLSSQGLVKTDWFEKKYHRQFTHDDLTRQIVGSKQRLEEEGYNPKTFAYPLGEWNEEIVKIIKEAGFIAGRDTSRDYTTLDYRTPTVSLDPEFIWHMHYYKPELDDLKRLKNRMGYSGWWQFEDGYRVENDPNNNIHRLSSLADLTSKTFEVVSLPDQGDKISNKFLLAQDGDFTLEIFASTGEKSKGQYSNLQNIKVEIDEKPLDISEGNKANCKLKSGKFYCSFFGKSFLKKGAHLLSITSNHTGFVRLDKFRIFRELSLKKRYKLSIIEYED